MPARRGDAYLAGLRDEREVYVGGRRVDDVVEHPGFRGVARELARLYDLQFDPDVGDVLTAPSPADGRPVSTSFLMATNQEDVRRRIEGEALRCDLTYGLMGRLPDYVNALLTDIASTAPLLAESDPAWGERAVRTWETVRDQDLALSHALADPHVDKSRDLDEQDALRAVDRCTEGLVVEGCKVLATLAPLSDEILVGPYSRRRPGEEAYALVFTIPVATPGVRLLCREPYDAGRSAYDRPLTSRFDEQDSAVVFERVLVPWDRVLLHGDVATYNSLLPAYPGYHLLQATIRATAKLRFVAGVCACVMETNGRSDLARYQEVVGEVLGYLEVAEGLVVAAAHEVVHNAGLPLDARPPEEGAQPSSWPPPSPFDGEGRTVRALASVRLFFPLAHKVAMEALQSVGSSGLVMTPSQADFGAAETGRHLDRYLRGAAGVAAEDRVRVFKLAWDILGEQFGSRSLLYEQFFAGDPVSNRVLHWHLPKKEQAEAMARRMLDEVRDHAPAAEAKVTYAL